MTLIVEDGTLVAGANTYLTAAEANTILANFGKAALVVGTAEASLKQAAQYLQGFSFKGYSETQEQSLIFPRQGIVIDGFEFPFDEIPNQLKNAQALAASLVDTGTSLYSDSSGQEIIQKTVDVISVTYQPSGIASSQPIFGMIQAQLKPLLINPAQLTVTR